MRTVILIAPLLALLMLSTGCGAFDFELEEVTEEERHASIRGRRYFNGDSIDESFEPD